MNPILRNVLAILIGAFIGAMVNMFLIMAGGYIIPMPEGADLSTMETLKASMHLMEPKNFIVPFTAHAVGTFMGALIGALIAVTHKMRVAMIIGFLFLIAGISAMMQLPAPLWFNALDMIVAYIPMAYIAGKLVSGKKKQTI